MLLGAKLTPNENCKYDNADDENCTKQQLTENSIIEHFMYHGCLHGLV
jgi:hypothetical protein